VFGKFGSVNYPYIPLLAILLTKSHHPAQLHTLSSALTAAANQALSNNFKSGNHVTTQDISKKNHVANDA
jgi:hypothetical protein